MVLINFVKQCYRNTCNIYRSAFLILPFWFFNISFQMHLFSVFRSLFYHFATTLKTHQKKGGVGGTEVKY